MKIVILLFLSCSNPNTESEIIINGDSYNYQNSKSDQGLLKNGLKIGAWKKLQEDSIKKVDYYYNNEVRFNLNKNDFKFIASAKEITDKFKVKYLRYWKSINTNGESLLSMKKPMDSIGSFAPTFSITEIKSDKNHQLEDVAQNIINQLSNEKESFGIIQDRIIKTKNTDYSSYKIIFTFTQNEQSYGAILLMLKAKDESIINFIGTCLLNEDQFIKYKCVFEEVFCTIEDINGPVFKKLDVLY